MILRKSYHDLLTQSLSNFKGPLLTSISTDAITIRLLGATIALMHETIMITNMCHCLNKTNDTISPKIVMIYI